MGGTMGLWRWILDSNMWLGYNDHRHTNSLHIFSPVSDY